MFVLFGKMPESGMPCTGYGYRSTLDGNVKIGALTQRFYQWTKMFSIKWFKVPTHCNSFATQLAKWSSFMVLYSANTYTSATLVGLTK